MNPDFSLFLLFLPARAGPEAEPAASCTSHGALRQQPGQLPHSQPGWAQGLNTSFSQDPSTDPACSILCAIADQTRSLPFLSLPVLILTASCQVPEASLCTHMPCLCFLQAPCLATCVLADSFASVPFSISLTGACHLSVQPLPENSLNCHRNTALMELGVPFPPEVSPPTRCCSNSSCTEGAHCRPPRLDVSILRSEMMSLVLSLPSLHLRTGVHSSCPIDAFLNDRCMHTRMPANDLEAGAVVSPQCSQCPKESLENSQKMFREWMNEGMIPSRST